MESKLNTPKIGVGWVFGKVLEIPAAVCGLAHPRFMSSQPQAHPHGGRVGVHHTIVVDPIVIAESNGGIVRLVHPKEDIDRICARVCAHRVRKKEGRSERNNH